MTEKRLARFKEVADRRQLNFTVILENVHDPHNISAVMRSCDAVGMAEIYVLHTEEELQRRHFKLGHRSSAGTRKWIDVQYFTDVAACFEAVHQKYDHVFATHMAKDSVGLYDLDLTKSVALLFGNEHDGVSEQALSHCDGNFIIPQFGMVQSLNISVACAVSVYEGLRQRKTKDFYGTKNPSPASDRQQIFEGYIAKHEASMKSNQEK